MLLTRINISQVPEPSSDFFHFFPKIFLVKRFLSPLSAANSFQANALKQNFFLFLRSFFSSFFIIFSVQTLNFTPPLSVFFPFRSLDFYPCPAQGERPAGDAFPSASSLRFASNVATFRNERPSSPPRFVININIAASTSAAKRFKTRRRAERNGRRRKS